MNWFSFFIPIALLTTFAVVRRAGQISVRQASEFLEHGAKVIDVRTPAEFRGGHLANAINIPHDQIQLQIARLVPDKQHVLLLHCQSGMRSALARRKLIELGYQNAFDLGSYYRAMRIAG